VRRHDSRLHVRPVVPQISPPDNQVLARLAVPLPSQVRGPRRSRHRVQVADPLVIPLPNQRYSRLPSPAASLPANHPGSPRVNRLLSQPRILQDNLPLSRALSHLVIRACSQRRNPLRFRHRDHRLIHLEFQAINRQRLRL
jgi:hypothetical protein